ncbi:MAG: SMI1/KNR4 family protein [Geodermatophilaceae bacterium]
MERERRQRSPPQSAGATVPSSPLHAERGASGPDPRSTRRPFGIDAGGAYFCFHYRLANIDPPVIFFVTDDLNAVPEVLADSFTEFLASLQ